MTKKILIFTFGALFIAIMAQLSIPLAWTPISFSLQSLSISLLTIFFMQNSFYGVLGYLFAATIGWPVLAGGAVNSWWFITPKAGYLIGFLIASLIVPRVLEWKKPKSFITSWMCFSLNEGIILLVGWGVLSCHFSFSRAWELGVSPFLIGAILKISIATSVWYKCRLKQIL